LDKAVGGRKAGRWEGQPLHKGYPVSSTNLPCLWESAPAQLYGAPTPPQSQTLTDASDVRLLLVELTG